MVENWLTTSWTEVWLVIVSAVAMLVALVTIIRLVGLRSLSKMSSFDFAVTVAVGSILATVAVSSTSLINGAIAAAALLGTQAGVAALRQRLSIGQLVDNTPLLLMQDGEFDEGALRSSRVTRSDVVAKLREANVLRLDQVRAVILEATGDVSVLHGDGPVDAVLLDGVDGVNDTG